jgi:Skp family chaperone for outer membrane proteins
MSSLPADGDWHDGFFKPCGRLTWVFAHQASPPEVFAPTRRRLFIVDGENLSWVEQLAADISTKIDTLSEELVVIRAKLEAIEEMLTEEELSEEDREALEEAMKEHERGETIPLDEALRKLK